MPWIVAVAVLFIIIGLARVFVINAQEINRDLNQRFSEFRERLESEANAVLADFLDAQQARDAGTGHARTGGSDPGDGSYRSPDLRLRDSGE